ncbi:hypothetical protein ACO0LL_18215 [Undibacterium sp. TC4M20W]
MPALPRQKTNFLKIVDAQLSFQRQADGKISGLVLHQNGRNTPGPRDAD